MPNEVIKDTGPYFASSTTVPLRRHYDDVSFHFFGLHQNLLGRVGVAPHDARANGRQLTPPGIG